MPGSDRGDADREELERLSEDGMAPPRTALRARIVLAALDGESQRSIARRLGVSAPTVALWRRRYAEEGVAGLGDRPRTGRPRFTEVDGRSGRSQGASSDPSGSQPEGELPGRPSEAQLEQLLEAASRTIAQRGFSATRVADIAEAAGVSPATIHYYFKTKEDILIRALLWTNARIMADLEALGSESDDSIVNLARFIERTIPYPGIQREEYLLEIDLWSQIRLHPELLPAWEAYCSRWIAHVTGIIRAGIESSRFEARAPAEEIADRLAALTDGLAAQAAVGAARMPAERARAIVLRFAAEQLGIEFDVLERNANFPSHAPQRALAR